jgi:hypothetical protein
MIGSFSQSSDVVTFTYDPSGTPELVYLGLAAQNLSGQAVGSYAITGASVKAFAGKSSSPDWFGGGGVTLITYGGANLAALVSAGNISVQKSSNVLSTAKWDAGSNLTLYPNALPNGFNKVYVLDWDGTAVEITSSCTITAGVSVVVPTSAVSNYSFGTVSLQVTSPPQPTSTYVNLERNVRGLNRGISAGVA